ncbi:MAG: hypothetical protein Q4G27_00955 [Flavobacteriaceae bacterium]|nr:hypothetical protein [Flavobacteriaceae bacterium]
MTYSTIIGLVLTAIGLLWYIIEEPNLSLKEFPIAAILGLGIGLFIGGIMGYAQKKRKKIVEPKLETHPQDQFRQQDLTRNDDQSGLKL